MDPDLRHRAASDMLEDALHQFDNIIGSSPADVAGGGGFVGDGLQGISQLLDDLRITIQAEQICDDETDVLLSLLSPDTLSFYKNLFRNGEESSETTKSSDFQKLRVENESLSLQVNVLTDQVELQMERMQEMSDKNEELRRRLLYSESALQKEIQSTKKSEREMISMREQVLLLTKAVSDIKEMRAATPSPSRIQRTTIENTVRDEREVVSPDEGIVGDVIDGVLRPKLKMPDPTATSTPISAPSIEHHTVKFDDGTPKKSPLEGAVSQSRSPYQQFRSRSLEGLHGKRIMPVEADSLRLSPNQSSDISRKEATSASTPVSDKSKSSNAISSSSPNLAVVETAANEEPLNHNFDHEIRLESPSPFQNRKKHGFKKFFDSFRLRKSQSTSIHAPDTSSLQSWGGKPAKHSVKIATNPEPFKRGGFRATAGARLADYKPKPLKVNSAPFAQWSADEVTDWLNDLGLDEYTKKCSNWIKNGSTLLQATSHDLEKELGMHNPLHKKKLMLSLQAVGEEDELEGQIINSNGMDHISVCRWLDDIGLPQYKDAFQRARVDFRMLHHLTIGDLQRMKISNLLHVLSLRRAIYTFRKVKFDLTQLKRRPVDTDIEKEQVDLWTNHRVMEWLRSIDLAEFATNLRGSGVHGSLMVLEPQFTGDVLASLLHIPTSKSLLRRHLVSKFLEIIPEEFMTLKEKELSINVMTKIKVGRRSFGPLTRLRNLGGGSYREFSAGEYVCPFETKNSGAHQSLSSQRRKLGAKLDMQDSKNAHKWDIADEPDIIDTSSEGSTKIKVVELDENATKKIGAFSAEIATMTNKWSDD